MATVVDPIVTAVSEILLSSNVHVKLVVLCSKGHLCVYVLMCFVRLGFFIMFYLSRTGKLDCLHCSGVIQK